MRHPLDANLHLQSGKFAAWYHTRHAERAAETAAFDAMFDQADRELANSMLDVSESEAA